jgi:predicted nucleic acid-binding protein
MEEKPVIVLDTDVLIEILRQRVEAKKWLESNATEPMIIHGVVAMEIINGSENKKDLQVNLTFLQDYKIVWPTPIEFEYAHELLIKYRLKTGIGIPDCLIAATVIKRSWQLYSFNLKHYRHISGLDAKIPYKRGNINK